MLDTLHFVRGAVADKGRDLVPVLTHFCVYQDRIQGADGRISIDAPCAGIGFEGVVPAERFLKAVDACAGEPGLRVTDKGKLVVERKPFRALLPLQAMEAFPKTDPSAGEKIAVLSGLIEALRQLRPFMSDDAERPWASTIYFDQEQATALAATNAMIAMVSCNPFRESLQLPVFCVDELLRIGTPPLMYSQDAVSVTFWWKDRWLRAQKIVAEWPVLTARKWLSERPKLQAIPGDLVQTIERMVPFCNDPKFPIIYFKANGLSTAAGDTQAEVSGFKLGEAAFHAENLLPMLRVCDKMFIAKDAAHFSGGTSFRGVMSILRV